MNKEEQVVRSEVARDLEHNYVVTAGAGTGKTTLLIDRILHCLQAGYGMEEIAAITFTEAAASELRDRLRSEIETRLHQGNPALWRRALSDLDRAAVTTIHSFAGSLLRDLPPREGLPVGARVVDMLQARVHLAAAWQRFVQQETRTVDEDWLAILERGSLASARELAFRIAENRDVFLDEPDLGDLSALRESLWSGFERAARELLAVAKPYLSGAGDSLTRLAAVCGRALHEPSGEPEARALRALQDPELPRSLKGSKKVWGDALDAQSAALDAARRALAGLKELALLFSLRDRHEATRHLTRKLRRFLALYAHEKKKAGVLDFQDLLLLTRDLLREDRATRRRLSRRFRQILVDEFQDTDPLQAEIVLFLCDADCHERDWTKVRLRPGSLFVVGDPKQAIYGWRRADMTVLEEVRALVVEQGGLERALRSNFRSSRSTVQFVNSYFRGRMREEDDGRLQPEYDPILHARDRKDPTGPALHVLGLTAERLGCDRLRATDAAGIEPMEIARLVMKLHGRAETCPRDGAPRPARYEDFAVLGRSNPFLRQIEEAFQDAEIPYVSLGAGGLFHREEISDLLLLLQLLHEPTDRISLAGVLRSPLFAFTDTDLFRLARVGALHLLNDPADAALENEDLRRRSLEAWGQLHRWRRLFRLRTARELLETLLDESRLLPVAAASFDADQRIVNLFKMLELADAYTPDANPTAAGFLGFLRALGDELPDEGESPLAEEGGDAVRLLTMHRAKGLEFPIVILGGLHAGTNSATDRIVVRRDPEGGPPGIAIPGGSRAPWSSLSWEFALKEWEGRRRNAEALRLLYVAMTRARDHLVLSGALTDRGTGSPFQSICDSLGLDAAALGAETDHGFVFPSCDGEIEVMVHAVAGETRPAARGRTALAAADTPPPDPAPWKQARAREEMRREEGRRLRDLPAELSVTEIEERRVAGEEPFPSGKPSRGGAVAAFIGSAVHEVIERTSPGAEDGWERRLELEIARAMELTDEERRRARRRAGDLLRGLFESDWWSRLYEARRIWNEVPFVLREGGQRIRGRVDRIVEWPDGTWEIVDWKTDDLSSTGRSADEAAGNHAAQARLYSLVIARALGISPPHFTFLYLDGCRAVRLPPET